MKVSNASVSDFMILLCLKLESVGESKGKDQGRQDRCRPWQRRRIQEEYKEEQVCGCWYDDEHYDEDYGGDDDGDSNEWTDIRDDWLSWKL